MPSSTGLLDLRGQGFRKVCHQARRIGRLGICWRCPTKAEGFAGVEEMSGEL